MEKIIITGAGGQLGSELCKILGDTAVGLHHGRLSNCIELTNKDQVRRMFEYLRPKIIINAAAYTDVDAAERYPHVAMRHNALGTRNLAQFCDKFDTTLIHVSTDYIFGQDLNRQKPYFPQDIPGPVNAYGLSKLASEHFVRMLCSKHYIVRSSGVYGHIGNNFVKTILNLGKTSDTLRIVDDQILSPTNVKDLAEQLIAIAKYKDKPTRYGTYHAANAGQVSWFNFTRTLFDFVPDEIKLRLKTIQAIKTDSKFLEQYAPRPMYSALNSDKISVFSNKNMRPWRDALKEFIKETCVTLIKCYDNESSTQIMEA